MSEGEGDDPIRWFDDAAMKSTTIFAVTPDAIFFSPDGTPGGVPSFGRGIINNPHLELLLWIPHAINIAPYEASSLRPTPHHLRD